MSDTTSKDPLQGHFENIEQQYGAAQMGMWCFLATEVMMFGGLFLAYTVYRYIYPEAWAAGSHVVNLPLGAFNTAVLIGSSLTAAMAVHAGKQGDSKNIIKWLLLTLVLGGIFLGVKGIEYHEKFSHHLWPGNHFEFHGSEGHGPLPGIKIYFALYFCMTGLHATHMIIGVPIILWMCKRAARGEFTKSWNAPIEMFGLYWHFVDIVWIFLFPLLYLLGKH